MLRVYLDQNKWVAFARHRVGSPDGAPWADAWTMAVEAVDRGLVSFPLSAVHYMETHKRNKNVSRWQLAETMALLSRMRTMAGPNTLVPAEVDAAVATVLDPHGIAPNPIPPKPIQPFGVGMAHAFGAPADLVSRLFPAQYLADHEVPLGQASAVRQGFIEALEFAVLA